MLGLEISRIILVFTAIYEDHDVNMFVEQIKSLMHSLSTQESGMTL